MNLDNVESISINGKEVEKLEFNGRIVYKSEQKLILNFTGDTFRALDSVQGLTGSNIVIDWGDGTTTNYVDKNSLNHTYSENGEYVIQITGNITDISDSCFKGVTFTSVVIPEGVTSLGDYCFSGRNILSSVVLPNGLTSIGDSCFSGSIFTTITIPESVTSIGDYWVGSNPNLTSIVLNWKNNNILQYDGSYYGWAGSFPQGLKFSIPSGTLQDYINAGFPSDKLIERSE